MGFKKSIFSIMNAMSQFPDYSSVGLAVLGSAEGIAVRSFQCVVGNAGGLPVASDALPAPRRVKGWRRSSPREHRVRDPVRRDTALVPAQAGRDDAAMWL